MLRSVRSSGRARIRARHGFATLAGDMLAA